MNTRTLGCCLFIFRICLQAWGQYSVDWFTADGGGGTCTGGIYTVTGTIGQPDAGGPLTGGGYSLTGGFWAVYLVQTPGAPTLTITRSGSGVIVSWPSPSTDWTLQQNTSLATTNWETPAQSVTDNGTIKYILVNPPTGNRFYRLYKP